MFKDVVRAITQSQQDKWVTVLQAAGTITAAVASVIASGSFTDKD
ncbi:hypothetical protein [Macrococcoides caseolyticum]|nr:hypothetical protein [Macrococcus caseolyticus]